MIPIYVCKGQPWFFALYLCQWFIINKGLEIASFVCGLRCRQSCRQRSHLKLWPDGTHNDRFIADLFHFSIDLEWKILKILARPNHNDCFPIMQPLPKWGVESTYRNKICLLEKRLFIVPFNQFEWRRGQGGPQSVSNHFRSQSCSLCLHADTARLMA